MFEGTYPKASLWDALCLHALWSDSDDPDDDPEFDANTIGLAPHLSKLVSPGARQQVEQQLRSALKTPHKEYITYTPCVNEHYPSLLRQHAASLFCTAGFPPCEEHPIQGVSIDIPHGILDDAPLAVMLGGVAWFATCLRWSDFEDSDDEHDEDWHGSYFCILAALVETFTEYPFPKLLAQGFSFFIELSFDFPGEYGHNGPKHILRIFTAVAIFLRNKNVLLQWCRRCQILYSRFSLDATHSTSINESSVNTDASDILSQSTSADIGLLCVSNTSSDYITNAKEIPHISEDLVGMDAFTSITLDKSLTKERVQMQLATKVQSLVCTSAVISLFLLIHPSRPDT